MTRALQIRGYRPADHDRVLCLHEAALRDAGGYIEGAPEPDLDAIEEVYCASGAFLVGVFGDRIVAMGAIRPATGWITEQIDCGATTAELKRLRVDPAHQRNGYGQAMLDALEERASAMGFDHVVLDTMQAQNTARAFFEANGYEERARIVVEFDGDDGTQLFYETSL